MSPLFSRIPPGPALPLTPPGAGAVSTPAPSGGPIVVRRAERTAPTPPRLIGIARIALRSRTHWQHIACERQVAHVVMVHRRTASSKRLK